MSLELARFDAERDAQRHRALFARSFPETAGTAVDTPEHNRWKFRTYPASPPSYEYVARERDSMLGYYAALPYRYRVNGRMWTAGMVCDVMTDPDARGKGVFTAIGRYATEDLAAREIAFTTGYPIRPEVLPGHLKVGWRTVVKLPLYLRPLRCRRMLPRIVRFAAPFVDACLAVVRLLIDYRPSSGAYDVRSVSLDALLARGDFGAFLARAVPPDRCVLERSDAFLRWRLSAPGTAYDIVQVTRNHELCAYAVTRAVPMGGLETLAVLDALVVPGERGALAALHHALLRSAKALRREAVVAMASAATARRLGFRGRFLATPHVFVLIVKRLHDAVPETVLKAGAWEPMWIDSDDL